MTPSALRVVPMPPMSRALALAIALILAFACLADVAQALGGEADGCPQAKVESQGSSVPPVDFAVLPARFDLGEPALLARVVSADRSIAAPSVFARRSAPRAPPTA